ncbi:hypothetical protein ACHQM5_028432 [Ranunculus cassubicifolius]
MADELDEALRVIHSSISQIKWRLSSSARRRLDIDILALCTGLRPVVMVDYGGKMPELQDHLCNLLQLSQKESSILASLKVMVIEDMIYLLNVEELATYVKSSLDKETATLFIDLEQDPPKIIDNTEQNSIASQFVSIQRIFSATFPADGIDHSQLSQYIDLSSCMQGSPVTIPTLNGWLLGYPIVYLFGTDHIEDAIYNLSTKSLRLYKILICRNDISGKETRQDELMSFSVPYDLSMGGRNEPWAEAFLSLILTKFGKCKHVWKELQMEVSECYPQSVVL